MLDRVARIFSRWAIFFKGLVLFIILPALVGSFMAAAEKMGVTGLSRFAFGFFLELLVVILTMIVVAAGDE